MKSIIKHLIMPRTIDSRVDRGKRRLIWHVPHRILRFGGMLLVLVAFASPARGQRLSGMVGIGGQIGDPSGLTVKVYRPHAASLDMLASWNLDDFFFMSAHGIYERHLDDQGSLHFFFGPGAFLGVRNRSGENRDDVTAGVGAALGLGFMIDRLELFGQITPRLKVTPSTEGEIGGGLGARFYF